MAKDRMSTEHAGILIYLEQEGRGAGLHAKARGYAYVEANDVDTFAAYRALGLKPDQRRYGAAVKLLRELDVRHVRLLTNNPAKVEALQKAGLRVDREPLIVKPNERNRAYLESKQQRGHWLDLSPSEGLDLATSQGLDLAPSQGLALDSSRVMPI
jgi:3,4-dihydroxy 2-butanone 4-phosphate synthase/GTP cyclohydrolase II